MAKVFILRTLELEYRDGMLLASSTCEGQTQGIGGATITFPPVSDPPESPSPPPEEPGRPPEYVSDASEIMFLVYSSAAGADPKLFWSGDFFNGGQPTYLEVTKPVGYSGNVIGFQAIQDGSAMFFETDEEIWSSSDVGSAAPTWTRIIAEGITSCLGGTVVSLGRARVIGARLYAQGTSTTAYWHGYFESGSWTFEAVLSFENMGLTEQPHADHYWGYSGFDLKLREATASGTVVDSYTNYAENHTSWQRHDGGDIKRLAEDGGSWYLRNCTTSTNLYTTTAPGGSVLKGALHGDQLCFTNATPAAVISDDGSTFEVRSTWQAGTILPAQLTGGDTLVWFVKQTASSNVFARLSYDGFDTAGTDMSGNFWTELYNAQFNLGDCCLIFR